MSLSHFSICRLLCLLCFLYASQIQAATIVLDAGHGGHDPGGIPGQRISEKNCALDVARRIQAKLKAAGHRVIMTRSSDVFVELSERVAISNRAPGKPVFVSIHFNSAPNCDGHGIETYHYDKRGAALARAIHSRVVRVSGGPDRGVRTARFYVLRYNKRPAVLAELGFLTNPQEGSRIGKSDAFRQKLADAVADGIRAVVR
ncbi:MAG: N-acetylmuramoyl-L-alanine amidase [Verrucomicrobiota bacterium]